MIEFWTVIKKVLDLSSKCGVNVGYEVIPDEDHNSIYCKFWDAGNAEDENEDGNKVFAEIRIENRKIYLRHLPNSSDKKITLEQFHSIVIENLSVW